MNAKYVSYVLILLCVVLTGMIIGSGALGDVVFKKQSEKLSELKAKNAALDQQSIGLIKAKQDVEQYGSLNEIAKKIVPQDKDQARTIREINQIASESGVTLSQISFEASSLGDNRKPPSGTTGTTTPSAAAIKSALTQVEPVPGISGVYSLAINVQSGESNPISYQQFLTFLEKLESNRRTAHVANINVTPSDDGQTVTFSLLLNAYVKP
jgi:hypothetical protein